LLNFCTNLQEPDRFVIDTYSFGGLNCIGFLGVQGGLGFNTTMFSKDITDWI
jgi:hypothetical protein